MKAMTFAIVLLLALTLPSSVAFAQDDSAHITPVMLESAEGIMGLQFTPEERDSVLQELELIFSLYPGLREATIDNSVAPALVFDPIPPGMSFDTIEQPIIWGPPPDIRMPENFNDLAFYSVRELSELIRTRKVSSMQLTRLALERLKKHDPQLHCVISLTEDLALEQARRADKEIAAGTYRGPLHGIPYGAKDLLAAKGYKTTWGAMPYKDQVIDRDATVIKKLEEAGAVLVAKLSLGALAWGDVWYRDTTRNPWDLTQGSSGSSAGSASAVSAGLVPFAIGSETWGSIISPSTRCGVTGLRPTFGRVSRSGAMALSWSMDKLGPICRTVEDCALVFDAIRGADGEDLSVVDLPFNYDAGVDIKSLRIGYLKNDFANDSAFMAFNNAALDQLREMGIELVGIELPQLPIESMSIILTAEAGAAFDELTRSNRDDLMVRQVKDAWPNVFRSARFIPAVEYIQANRLRSMAIAKMAKIMADIDVYVAPSFEGNNLLLTNLTGHPCVVLPDGFDDEGHPVSITFMGRLYDEATLVAVAKAYQEATDWHQQHPPLFLPEE